MTTDDVRARLEAERTRLLDVHAAASRLHSDEAAGNGETMSRDATTSEQATETFGRELDESVAQHAESELNEIAEALARLDAGTYGVCEACGNPIGDGRLEILPATRYCIDDAAKLERSR